MEATTPPPLQPLSAPALDFFAVLAESRRIVNAHSRHFLALSVAFLLPLSFSAVVYPAVQELLAQPPADTTRVLLRVAPHDPPLASPKTLALALAYAVFACVSSLSAAGSITCSVFHGFYGRPVKLVAAIRSISRSFFPLLATALVSHAILLLAGLAFGVLLFLAVEAVRLLGYGIELDSPFFMGLSLLGLVCFLLLCLYLRVNWTLACVVVVVESSWGFAPLRRSAGLIKGLRGIALSSLLFFGLSSLALIWCSSMSAPGFGDASDGWKSWAFVLQIVVSSTLLTLLSLYSYAANAVLYMYCKAIHGELAGEIAEEFAREYVSLPFDDGKVPHIVSVVYA